MIMNPAAIPLTSLAVLNQTSVALSDIVRRLFEGGGSIVRAFDGVEAMYELDDIVNEIKDGQEPYPSKGSSDKKGMEIEFK